jgi:glycosyltransferase involved in cell wall biosynthesis
MPAPKVSVIMAVHNEEDFLAEAVESALAQDYPSLEVVISDDGSTDRTREIARGFAARQPERVVLVHGDSNEGKAVAANRALAAAKGELVAWLDGDDVMLPGKLSAQVAMLERRPDAVGCTHDAEVFDSDSGEVLGSFTQIYNGRPLREGGVDLWFDPTYRMLPSATMFRAAAAPAHGLDPRLTRVMDWLFDIEVFRNGTCVASQEMLVRYRRHSGQLTAPENRERGLEGGLLVMDVVEARYPELRRQARSSRAALLLGESRRLARLGDRRAALARASEGVRAGGPHGVARIATHLVRAARDRRRTRRDRA